MAEFNAGMRPPTGELSVKVIRANGTVEDLGVVSRETPLLFTQEQRAPRWIRYLAGTVLILGAVGLIVVLAIFFSKLFLSLLLLLPMFGLVTTAGINYLMGTVFVASTINFHDSGTGTAAATIADTALQTPTGGARVSGAQSNPGAGQYQSLATIPYSGPFVVAEWGIFSASSGPTLWDRRVGWGPVTVGSGDSIQFKYILTGNAGGS